MVSRLGCAILGWSSSASAFSTSASLAPPWSEITSRERKRRGGQCGGGKRGVGRLMNSMMRSTSRRLSMARISIIQGLIHSRCSGLWMIQTRTTLRAATVPLL
jgi:hypothetical protein